MRNSLWIAGLIGAAGCGGVASVEIDEPSYLDHDLGESREGLTVAGAGGCDTSIVKGLSDQLVAELNCIAPGSMVSFLGPDVHVTSAVEPYLEPNAAAGLHQATAQQNDFITINSAYRSVAQQYLLYKWWQAGQCGIQLAASPGTSNHQSGRAVDVPSYSYWMGALQNHGWTWFGSADVVHFDYTSAPDRRSDSVLAFQRLWNKNNPANMLAEDGSYGPATDSALASSDTNGFPIFGCATAADAGTDAGAVDAGERDAGVPRADAGVPESDAGRSGEDAGPGHPDAGSGSFADAGNQGRPPLGYGGGVHQGCSAIDGAAAWAWVPLALVLASRRRRS